jgi:tetratricopeptide (TPR) repeat protein
MRAQSATPPASQPATPPSTPQDNPFPEDVPATAKPAPQNPGKGNEAVPDASAGKPKSENPFPGEDPNAPIIPVDPGSGSGSDSGANWHRGPNSGSGSDSGASARRDADPDGDPVRSPDGNVHYAEDDRFSSSRSGVSLAPAGDDSEVKPGQSARSKTREQQIKEDLDVGEFYLSRKNWKGAQARYQSAFVLDAENPDTVWGLAEAERHLQLYKEAEGHYKLFLSYEPDGRRGREARKALEEVEAALPSAAAASKTIGQESIPQK